LLSYRALGASSHTIRWKFLYNYIWKKSIYSPRKLKFPHQWLGRSISSS